MIKWFVYIVVLLILIPGLSLAVIDINHNGAAFNNYLYISQPKISFADSSAKTSKQLKQQQDADNKKVKQLTNAKHLPKPEKVDQAGTASTSPAPPKAKPKRQRRPPGLERPPELPRRYGN